MRKSLIPSPSAATPVEAGPPVKGFVSFPLLWSVLADPRYDDGSARQLGSLIIFVDGPEIKGCLTDKDSGLVAFRTAKDLAGLLQAFEKGLEEGSMDWRVSKASQGKGKGKA